MSLFNPPERPTGTLVWAADEIRMTMAGCEEYFGLCVSAGLRQRWRFWLATLLLILSTSCCDSRADPETWIAPSLTQSGNASSGLGTSVACSEEDPIAGHSWFAAGAPQEASGEGRVYILNTSGIVQTLQSTSPGSNRNFGYFVGFLRDINEDGISELVVGEPNPSGATGYLHVYRSTGNPSAPFTHCTSTSGPPSYASYIVQTAFTLGNTAQVILGNPTAAPPRLAALRITYDILVGYCIVNSDGAYNSEGDSGSRYGQSIGEIDTGRGLPTLLIGAPGLSGSAGGVYQEEAGEPETLTFPGTGAANVGASIASRYNSSLLAFSAPFGTETIAVKFNDAGIYSSVCDVQVPMSSLAPTASQSLVHLERAFDGFVGSAGSVFGSYRDEPLTGGSVVLFGADPPLCTPLKQINNCAADPNQKQGVAIAGGPACYWTGNERVFLVGSPGFSNNAGRIDVYRENSALESPSPCSIPTTTPTATPTAPFTSTPESESPLPPSPGFDSTPMVVEPSTRGLPAPFTSVVGKSATIVAPRLVGRRLKFLGYLFTVSFRRIRPSVLVVESLDALRTREKKREIFSRRNRISLRKLVPGSYVVTYRPVFQSPKSRLKRILGKASAQGTFSIR